MKGVLLIIDGLGDLPVEALGGKTPLEAAHTPVMDRLAATGRYGLVDTAVNGETPSTYSGAGALMGMLPEHTGRLGRGPVEAAGLDMELLPGDVALRANFATVTAAAGRLLVTDRRAGRISEGADELAAVLDRVDLGDGITGTLRPTHQHRAVLVLSGPGLAASISDTDPGDGNLPAAILDCVASEPASERTAAALNRFLSVAHERLEYHPVNLRRAAAGLAPANGIITRGAGAAAAVANIVCDAGLDACVITGCNTVAGLGRISGFDVVTDTRFSGDLNTDLDAKIAAAILELNHHDLAFIHIKAPDICAHDREPVAKRDFLEKIDAALAPLVAQQIVIAVAADHTTDSNSGLHTDDPIPALLNRPDNRRTEVPVNFGETACRDGNFERQVSQSFLLEFIEAVQ